MDVAVTLEVSELVSELLEVLVFVEVVEGVGVAVNVDVSDIVEDPVAVRVFVDVVEGVGVAVIVLVKVCVLVPVDVIELVDVVDGVLLSLGHVAPTQHFVPSNVPPPLGQEYEAQHPLPHVTPCKSRTCNILAEPPLHDGAQ